MEGLGRRRWFRALASSFGRRYVSPQADSWGGTRPTSRVFVIADVAEVQASPNSDRKRQRLQFGEASATGLRPASEKGFRGTAHLFFHNAYSQINSQRPTLQEKVGT